LWKTRGLQNTAINIVLVRIIIPSIERHGKKIDRLSRSHVRKSIAEHLIALS